MSDPSANSQTEDLIAPTAGLSGGVRTASKHDSGPKHVAGEAVYIDDIIEPFGTLHLAPVRRRLRMAKSPKWICPRSVQHPVWFAF